MVRLNVLDQSPIKSGGTASEAIGETIGLAQAAEKLGYKRYWLAEHHGTQGLAGCAPEILVDRIASCTSHIRVGSGGVMLNHYSPLKVAETFSLLSTMYPDRIDLGLGRAPGGDKLTIAGMQYGSNIGVEFYPTKVQDLIGLLNNTETANKVFSKTDIVPWPTVPPQIWLLGSSEESAKLSAAFGLPFCFAHFINAIDMERVLKIYKDNFQRSVLLDKPFVIAAVGVVCAETQETADYLALSRKLWRLQLAQGQLGPYPTPEDAANYPYTSRERKVAEAASLSAFVGTPKKVKDELDTLSQSLEIQEFCIVTITHDAGARLRSYELLAKEFCLPPVSV
jgi:luciferase family oxidoreductase group 1